jgi:hypothetical protein
MEIVLSARPVLPQRHVTQLLTRSIVGLGGLMVIVLATEPKVCGFKPGRGRWIFKPLILCRKILQWHVKEQCGV